MKRTILFARPNIETWIFIDSVGFIRGSEKKYCFGGTGTNVYEVKFKAGEYITGVNFATGFYYVHEVNKTLPYVNYIILNLQKRIYHYR